MLHPTLETAFDDLLTAWRHLDDARRRRDAVPRLAEARWQYEDAKDRVRRLRRSLAPEPLEVQEARISAYCPAFDQPVVVYGVHPYGDRPTSCVCGAPFER